MQNMFVFGAASQEKDTYGNKVTQLARPLPIEYLLIDVPVSTPLEPQFTFQLPSDTIKAFPIENRSNVADIQDFDALASYIRQFPEENFLQGMSNFHLLIYLATADMLPVKVGQGQGNGSSHSCS